MRRLVMMCTLLVLFGGVSGPVQAGPDTRYVDIVDATSGQTNTYFVPADVPDDQIVSADGGIYNRFYAQDWGWTHTFSASALAPGTINWAKLEITAYDVDPGEIDVISADGFVLGPLAGVENAWSTTTMNLSGPVLDELLDGTIDIWMDIDSTNPGIYNIWAASVGSSTLTISREVVVPAPGAVLLSSIGIGMVSWLRRRRLV